jgi:membrane-associated phospholipid phosphatase
MFASALMLSGALMAPSPDSVSSPATAQDSLGAVEPYTPPPSLPTPPSRHRSHRGIPSRLGGAAVNFGSDTWYVVSSPARLNLSSALQAGLVLGATAALYQYDQDIWNAAHRNSDDPTFQAVKNVGGAVEPLGFMPHAFMVEGATWLVGEATGIEPLRVVPVQLAESHLIAGGIRNVLKLAVGRKHPFEGEGAQAFGGGSSFPSGHTSVEFEIATIVSAHAHSVPVTALLYSLATAGAVQRVQTGAHWSSDVLLPAVTGTAIAATVVRRNSERETRDAARWQPEFGVVNGETRFAMTRRF